MGPSDSRSVPGARKIEQGGDVYDNDRSGFVYVIQDGTGLCKIGRARNVEKRIRSLSTGSSSDLTLVASWPCDDASEHEATMHESYSDLRVRGEWFRIPDSILTVWREFSGKRIPRESEMEAWVTEAALRVFKAKDGPTVEKLTPPWKKLPGSDGGWWICQGSQVIVCGRCKRETNDSPGVMRYVERADWGKLQAKCHPEWPALGWVVWRQCELCSWMDFKTEYVTTETIQAWALGAWRPMP